MAEREYTLEEIEAMTGPARPKEYSMREIEAMDADVSKLESGGRGLLQGATFNLADEIAGAGEAGYDVLVGNTPLEQLAEAYRQRRDESREAFGAAQEANPFSYGAGELGGAVGTAFIPGLGAARLASVPGRLAAGAGAGAAQAIGASESEDVEDIAKEALTGGATGLAFGGLGETLPAVGRGAKKLSNIFTKAHLRPTSSMLDKLGKKSFDEVSEQVMATGAIKPFTKVGATATRLKDSLETAGKNLDDIIRESPAIVPGEKVAARVQAEVVEPLKTVAATEGEGAKIARLMKSYLKKFAPETGPEEQLTLLKSELEKRGWAQKVKRGADANQTLNKAYKQVERIMIEEGERAAADPAFEAAKRVYGNLAVGEKAARKSANIHGLMSHMADIGAGLGSLGLMTSDSPTTRKLGAALGIGRALTKGRLASTGATGSRALSELLKRPGAAGVAGRALTDMFSETGKGVWESLSTGYEEQ